MRSRQSEVRHDQRRSLFGGQVKATKHYSLQHGQQAAQNMVLKRPIEPELHHHASLRCQPRPSSSRYPDRWTYSARSLPLAEPLSAPTSICFLAF